MIRIWFIRHAFSRGNALSKLGGQFFFLHKMYQDPPLTSWGTNQCTQLIKTPIWPKHFNFVFASHLLRALETAVIVSSNQTIYSIPSLGEKAIGLDNYPIDKTIQQCYLDNHQNRIETNPWPELNNINNVRNIVKELIAKCVSRIVPEQINPNEMNKEEDKGDDKGNDKGEDKGNDQDVNILIVTHGYFLKEYFGLNYMPGNGFIAEEAYRNDPTNHHNP